MPSQSETSRNSSSKEATRRFVSDEDRPMTENRPPYVIVAPGVSAPQQITEIPSPAGEEPRKPLDPTAETAAPTEPSDAGLTQVKSPIVGTFYEAPSPDAEPFVEVGDQITAGRCFASSKR